MVSTRMGASTGYLPESVYGVSPTKVRKVPQKGPSNAKPFALRFKLASSLQSHRRLFLLTFVPAACFPGSCFGFRVEGTNLLAQPSDQNGFVPGAKWAEAEVLANLGALVALVHSPSKYASAGTPIWLARCATTLPAKSARRSGNRPSNWNAFNSTAKRRRVTPVLLPSSSSSSGLSVQHWASSSGCHARFMGFGGVRD